MMNNRIVPLNTAVLRGGLRLDLRAPYRGIYGMTSANVFKLVVVHTDDFVTIWRLNHHVAMPDQTFSVPPYIASLLVSDQISDLDGVGLAADEGGIQLVLYDGKQESELSWRFDPATVQLPAPVESLVAAPQRSVQVPYAELDEVLGKAMDELSRLTTTSADMPLIVSIDFAPLQLSVAGHDIRVLDKTRCYYDLRRFIHCMELLESTTVTIGIEERNQQSALLLETRDKNWQVSCVLLAIPQHDANSTQRTSSNATHPLALNGSAPTEPPADANGDHSESLKMVQIFS